MRRVERPVVYVHPPGNPEDDVIPFGLVGIMNALRRPKLGLFSHELTETLLREAGVLLVDMHWVHNLGPAVSLCREVRRLVPTLPIVAGGYTSTVFARSLVDEGVVDYVIAGDAEVPALNLLDALCSDGSVDGIPNLVTRELDNRGQYHLTADDFDRFDYTSLGWFPSLDARVRLQHAAGGHTKNPLVVTYKGCHPPAAHPTPYCRNCYGQPRVQRKLFQRNLVHRSPERVRDDLRRLSADPTIRRVHIFDDFVAILGEAYAREVLKEDYQLDLYMEPYLLFSPEIVGLLARSFERIELVFYHVDIGAMLERREEEAERFLQAAHDCQIKVGICVVQPPSAALVERARKLGVRIFRNESEVFSLPNPFAEAEDLANEYRRFLHVSSRFSVLKLVADLAPAYLDAIAVQLNVAGAAALSLDTTLPHSGRAARPTMADNPVHRHVMSGANPLDLTFHVAPFVLGTTPLATFDRIPRGRLMASPLRIEATSVEFREGAEWGFTMEFEVVRAGRPDGLAINFVSEQHGRMAGLPYESLWKLCLPMHTSRVVRAGERMRVRATLLSHLDPPVDLRVDMVS